MPAPSTDEIEVCAFPLEGEGGLCLDLARRCLSAEEMERAASFRFDTHRERFMRGRAMVRMLLGRRLGEDPASLVFGVGPRGKPHLREGELHFNLSHSEDRAVVAVSRMPNVGIDLERFDRRVDVAGLGRRCFLDSETSEWENLDDEGRRRSFFWLWTAKEARMKATGEGFALEPRRIEIECGEGLPRRYLAPATPPAYLAPVLFPEGDTACTVAALSPFRIRIVGEPI